jgi:hypothetical protein
MPQQRQVETFVHEVLHMVLYEAGLDDKPEIHKELNPMCNILTRMFQENDFGWIYRHYEDNKVRRAITEIDRLRALTQTPHD